MRALQSLYVIAQIMYGTCAPMLVCVSMDAVGFPLIMWHQQMAHLTNQPCVMPAQTRLTAVNKRSVNAEPLRGSEAQVVAAS